MTARNLAELKVSLEKAKKLDRTTVIVVETERRGSRAELRVLVGRSRGRGLGESERAAGAGRI